MHGLCLRLKAVIHYNNFEKNIRKVAQIYNISTSTVARWVNEDNEGRNPGTMVRAKIQRSKRTDRDVDALIDWSLKSVPYMTGHDLVDMLSDKLGRRISTSTVQRARNGLGFTLKVATRSHHHQPVPNDHPFLSDQEAYDGDVVAVDECGFVSSDRPRRGWSKRSQRLASPLQRCVRYSLLLAIDRQGVVAHEIKQGGFNGKT